MSLTQELIECPICYEEIGLTNNINTECGHKFHASCLMKNVIHNGFNCPCCRTVMAEQPEEKEDYDDMPSLEEYDETDTLLDEEDVNEEPFSDDALRGLRLLTNLLEGEQHSELDVIDEYQYNDEYNDISLPVPQREMIESCLKEQGITYGQLVAWILLDHQDYEDQVDELERFSSNLWVMIQTIIRNYTPEPEVIPPVVEESHIPVNDDNIFYEIEIAQQSGFYIDDRRSVLPIVELDDLRVDLASLLIDYEAQPKMPMIHV